MVRELNIKKDESVADFCTGTGSFLIEASKYTDNLIGCEKKEDLYTIYKSFYRNSNMFLVVTGNVNYKEVFEIVEKNTEKKNPVSAADAVSASVHSGRSFRCNCLYNRAGDC